MTTEHARAIAADLQDRANQMGDRTGEGLHLGRAASTILGLCAQLESLPPPEVTVAPETQPMDGDEPKKRGRPRKV